MKKSTQTPDHSMLGPALLIFVIVILSVGILEEVGIVTTPKSPRNPVAVKTYMFEKYNPLAANNEEIDEWGAASEPLHISATFFYTVDDDGNLIPFSE